MTDADPNDTRATDTRATGTRATGTRATGTRATGTRARILQAAQDLFESRGCQRTSVREIAERLGLTKTAVLYHFTTKADILAELATPLLDDLEAALAAVARRGAGPVPPSRRETRQRVAEGLLDVYLTHRQVLNLVIQNLAVFAQEPAYQRFVATMVTANGMMAGPDPDFPDQVRAVQAVAMLSDPVILLTEASSASLRREILAGVGRLFDAPAGRPEGPREDAVNRPAAPAPTRSAAGADPSGGIPLSRRRAGGRPSSLTAEAVAEARRMRASGAYTAAEIAAAFGVSRATLYRHL